METEGPRVAALIEALSTLVDEEGRWSIQAEEAARLLGVDRVRFWRAVHDVKDRISLSDAIDGWTQDTVGDLVTVMERLAGDGSAAGSGPEAEMTRAGLFLPHALGIELIDELLWKARSLAAAHEVRSDELAAMLRYTGNVRDAVGIYLDSCADTDELIDASAESFRVLQGMPPCGGTTARRYLRSMLARHVVDRRSLLAGLRERLVLEAARLGYMDPEDRARAEEAGARAGPGSDRHAWARRVMGLDGKEFTAEELRSVYRRLMMRHHPDVDPAGLETCKDVNVAYACLIADLSGRSGR